MSYRINRAMGYGMPYEQFKDVCILPKDNDDVLDGVLNVLYNAFEKLTDADLTVDDKLYRALFYGDGVKPAPVLQTRLLAEDFTRVSNKPCTIGKAEDLFVTVTTPDETTDIIFFPNLYFRKKWYRWDDELDYAFEQWRSGSGDRSSAQGPQDFTIYTEYGHHPFSYDIMDINGNPLKWEPARLNQHSNWIPAVPSEIRWYLTQHGIMFNEGVNQLRPVVAQWWS